jgi:pyridinium-3,5-biscarboxylic acid mononucleotide sulfurtransferase
LAQQWNLSVWDRPASPCLSSRLAPGVEATLERVQRVEAAESFLHSLGYDDCRVRVHAGELARVELPAKEIDAFFVAGHSTPVCEKLLQLGFRFATIDMAGFKSGGFNEMVPLEIRARFSRT